MKISLAHRFLPLLFVSMFLIGCPAKDKAPPPAAPPPPSAAAPAPTVPVADSNAAGAVKKFFTAVYEEKYDQAWSALTKKSQDKFVTMVAEEEKMDPAKIREMFQTNASPMRLGFWKSFRESSKVATFVPNATYKETSQSGNEATVELTSGDVTLPSKVFKEGNDWKLGYVESFMD